MNMQLEKARVLCVDDEEAVLRALRRVFRGKRYELEMATSGREGLDLIAKNDYDLIISDMRMPKMDGAEFLHAASVFAPDTARILLTGYSEHSATERAINNGKITAFVSKPWDNAELLQTVERALLSKWHLGRNKQCREKLQRKNKTLLDQNKYLRKEVDSARLELDQSLSLIDITREETGASFQAAVNLLSNIVNQRQGCEYSTYESIAELSANLGAKLGLKEKPCEELRWAGRLFPLGRLSCNDELLARQAELRSREEQAYYCGYPKRGADLLAVMEGMHGVANIVRHHCENFDGSGFPSGLRGADIPFRARILNVVIEVQRLREDSSYSLEQKKSELKALRGARYDPEVVDILLGASWDELCAPAVHDVRVGVDDFNEYMQVSRNVYDARGQLVIAQGAAVKEVRRQKLLKLQKLQARDFEIVIEPDDLDLRTCTATASVNGGEN